MAEITRATALANNEVAYLAWATDPERIPGCLGFHIVREYLDAAGKVTDERPLASYVAFKGQRNPDWQAQNTTVWPVQKFTWRDLTLRKRRDRAERRPDNERVRYRIRAVARMQPGLEPVVIVPESHRDKKTGLVVPHTYTGDPIPLGYLTDPAFTNVLDVTTRRPPFTSTFTNGILSTQFLVRVLEEDGAIQPGELEAHLRKPQDWLRDYLAGDVLSVIRDFFSQAGGRFHAALYELEDEELVDLLKKNAERLDLILSDAGSGKDEEAEEDENGKKPTLYDTRNSKARKALRALAKKPGTTFRMQDRMFNGSGHIGHNKFVVHLDAGGQARSVLTGSTNWTWSGVAGQSNNCIRIDDDDIAGAFLAYWKRLHDDVQKVPKPSSARATGADQGDALKTADRDPVRTSPSAGVSLETWFSPNMPGESQRLPSRQRPRRPRPRTWTASFRSCARRGVRSSSWCSCRPAAGSTRSCPRRSRSG